MCIVIHHCQEELTLSWLQGKELLEDPCLKFFWTLPETSPLLAYFNLYPFPIINCDHEYRSFQGIFLTNGERDPERSAEQEAHTVPKWAEPEINTKPCCVH